MDGIYASHVFYTNNVGCLKFMFTLTGTSGVSIENMESDATGYLQIEFGGVSFVSAYVYPKMIFIQQKKMWKLSTKISRIQ